MGYAKEVMVKFELGFELSQSSDMLTVCISVSDIMTSNLFLTL